MRAHRGSSTLTANGASMTRDDVSFVDLRGLDDELLLPWLDLYETAFPAAEKVLVSNHLAALQGRPEEPGEHHLMAALSGGQFAGLARYHVLPEIATSYLWYLATRPELRSRGIGAELYGEIVRRAQASGMRTLMLEVEIPEEMVSPEMRILAERRIGFYRRQGARLLTGIHYLQFLSTYHQPVPMHLLFHPITPLTATEAFETGKALFEEWLEQTGELRLE
jgi:ribosomal protein S18 acetylase RimI-like enzyme